MRFLSLFLLSIIGSTYPFQYADGQNLVPNGSFESYKSLPDDDGELHLLNFWNNLNRDTSKTLEFGTPDFFHVKGNGKSKLPLTHMGTIFPRDGEGLVGLIAYHGNEPDFREYLSVPLVRPLQVGGRYKLSFSFSNAFLKPYGKFGASGLALALTIDEPVQNSNETISANAQLRSDSILYSEPWKVMEQVIVADNEFAFLTIGNFFNDDQTKLGIKNFDGYDFAYYFIDDVRVDVLWEPQKEEPEEPETIVTQPESVDEEPKEPQVINPEIKNPEREEKKNAEDEGNNENEQVQQEVVEPPTESSTDKTEPQPTNPETTANFEEPVTANSYPDNPNRGVFRRGDELSLGKIFVLDRVAFGRNSAVLSEAAIEELDILGAYLERNPTLEAKLLGHTSDEGHRDRLQELSEKRANACKAYLVGNWNILEERITAIGYGKYKRRCKKWGEYCRNQNRRVELIVNRI